MGLEFAPEGEVKYHSHNLKLKSRDHGFLLDKTAAEELAHLSMYHNPLSRGVLQHPLPAIHPVVPSRRIRDLSGDLHSTSHSLHSIGVDTIQNEMCPYMRK